MGSKRTLSAFLVEAISSVLSPGGGGTVVDLMCGSGVTSGAFSKFWDVISSDAQKFCRILSVVHGGGFSKQEAANLLDRIIPQAKKHSENLKNRLTSFIDKENIIFHSDIGDDLLKTYRDFINDFPTFSNKKITQAGILLQRSFKDKIILNYILIVFSLHTMQTFILASVNVLK